MAKVPHLLLLLSTLAKTTNGGVGFGHSQQKEFLEAWPDVIKDSYDAPLPAGLKAACSNKGLALATSDAKETAAGKTYTSSEIQALCGGGSCVVSAGSTLNMDGNLNLASLVVKGTLLWSDKTQSDASQWLCAGYLTVEDGGVFNLDVQSGAKEAFVFIKDNGMRHSVMGDRVFGGIKTSAASPTVHVTGRPLQRAWSLLAAPVAAGEQKVSLMHSPGAMGWRVGDRVVIAPTRGFSQGDVLGYTISALQDTDKTTSDGGAAIDGGKEGVLVNSVTLDRPVDQTHDAEGPRWAGKAGVALLSAEVINLKRNVVLTGDDFTDVPCDPSLDATKMFHDGCTCSKARSRCTNGMHTVMAFGGEMRVKHARVEKCGQRGVFGRYVNSLLLKTNAND